MAKRKYKKPEPPKSVGADNSIVTGLVVAPGQKPRISYIANSLPALQGIVAGHIEAVHLSEDMVLVCNEEGKLRNLPRSGFKLHDDPILGTFIVMGLTPSGEEFGNLCPKNDLGREGAVESWVSVLRFYGLIKDEEDS